MHCTTSSTPEYQKISGWYVWEFTFKKSVLIDENAGRTIDVDVHFINRTCQNITTCKNNVEWIKLILKQNTTFRESRKLKQRNTTSKANVHIRRNEDKHNYFIHFI